MKAKNLLVISTASLAVLGAVSCGGKNHTTHPSVTFYGVDSLNYDAKAAKEAQYGKDLVIEFTPNNQFAHLDQVDAIGVKGKGKVAKPYVGYGNMLNPIGYQLQENKAYTYKQVSNDKYQLTIKGDYFKNNIVVSFNLGDNDLNEQYGVTPVQQLKLDNVAANPKPKWAGFTEDGTFYQDSLSNYIFSDFKETITETQPGEYETDVDDNYKIMVTHQNPVGSEPIFAEYNKKIYYRDYNYAYIDDNQHGGAKVYHYLSGDEDLTSLDRDYYSVTYEKYGDIPNTLIDISNLKFKITATRLKTDGTESGTETFVAIDEDHPDGDYNITQTSDKIYFNFPWTTKGSTQDAHGGLFYKDVKESESGYAIKYKDVKISYEGDAFKIKNGLTLKGFGGYDDEQQKGDVEFNCDVRTYKDKSGYLARTPYRLCYGDNFSKRALAFTSDVIVDEPSKFDVKAKWPSVNVTLKDSKTTQEIKFDKNDTINEVEFIYNTFTYEGETIIQGVKVCYTQKSNWQLNCVRGFQRIVDTEGKTTATESAYIEYTVIPANLTCLLASDNSGSYCSDVIVEMKDPTK